MKTEPFHIKWSIHFNIISPVDFQLIYRPPCWGIMQHPYTRTNTLDEGHHRCHMAPRHCSQFTIMKNLQPSSDTWSCHESAKYKVRFRSSLAVGIGAQRIKILPFQMRVGSSPTCSTTDTLLIAWEPAGRWFKCLGRWNSHSRPRWTPGCQCWLL